MHNSDHGMLTRDKFKQASSRVGLDADLADRVFLAADLHNQKFLDYENLATVLLDLDDFDEETLLCELRSVISRMQGPTASRWDVDPLDEKEPDSPLSPGSTPPKSSHGRVQPTLDVFRLSAQHQSTNDP